MVALASLGLLSACARAVPSGPERFYAAPPGGERTERAPVVVIPGIPPLRLSAAEAASLAPLPMRQGAILAELREHPGSHGAWPMAVSDGAPSRRTGRTANDLLAALRLGGYRTADMTAFGNKISTPGSVPAGSPDLFLFEYDWRRDLVESAALLHRFLLARRAELQAARRAGGQAQSAPVRFDVLADGAGGVLLRYYLRYGDADLPEDGTLPPLTWKGTGLVARAVLIGTPNAGSLGPLLDLVGGEGASRALPGSLPPVVGTYPSFYQMLPRGRHGSVVRMQGRTKEAIGDLFDAAVWENLGWGLASSDDERLLARLLPDADGPVDRRRIALDHLRKCLRRARRFCEALDVPGHPPSGISLHLMAVDNRSTDAVAGIEWSTGRVRVIEQGAGDGFVLRGSALLDERVGAEWSPTLLSPIDWASVRFFHTDGGALAGDPAFIDNLLFLLLEQPRRSAG